METLRPPPDGDQNRAPALLAIFWAPFVLTVALLSARIFVRIKSQTLGVDDYSMFLAWVRAMTPIWISSLAKFQIDILRNESFGLDCFSC